MLDPFSIFSICFSIWNNSVFYLNSLNFILHTTVSFTGSALLSEAFVPLTSHIKDTHVCPRTRCLNLYMEVALIFSYFAVSANKSVQICYAIYAVFGLETNVGICEAFGDSH